MITIILSALVGATATMIFTLVRERIIRLRTFRNEVQIVLAKLEGTESIHILEKHEALAERLLEQCARINEDIPAGSRGQFDSAAKGFIDGPRFDWVKPMMAPLFPKADDPPV